MNRKQLAPLTSARLVRGAALRRGEFVVQPIDMALETSRLNEPKTLSRTFGCPVILNIDASTVSGI